MKQPLFSLPRTLGLHAIVTFLVGIGCVYPLSLSLGLTAPVSLGVACCLLVTFLFAAFDCVPRFRALAYPALFLGIAALAIRYAGQVSAISAAIVLMVNGQSLALIAYSRAIVVLLSLLFTGVGASLARSDQAFFPLALVTIALLNQLRTDVRETEVAAASAFHTGAKYTRGDIIEELNRMSSAVHILMCRYLAGQYKTN